MLDSQPGVSVCRRSWTWRDRPLKPTGSQKLKDAEDGGSLDLHDVQQTPTPTRTITKKPKIERVAQVAALPDSGSQPSHWATLLHEPEPPDWHTLCLISASSGLPRIFQRAWAAKQLATGFCEVLLSRLKHLKPPAHEGEGRDFHRSTAGRSSCHDCESVMSLSSTACLRTVEQCAPNALLLQQSTTPARNAVPSDSLVGRFRDRPEAMHQHYASAKEQQAPSS